MTTYEITLKVQGVARITIDADSIADAWTRAAELEAFDIDLTSVTLLDTRPVHYREVPSK